MHVVDQGNHRVQHFDPSGAFIETWGVRGIGPGEFDIPRGIAIAPDGKTLYVADTENARVQALDLAGNYLGQWGGSGDVSFPVAVAAGANGDVYITSPGHGEMMHFDAGGAFRGRWGNGSRRTGCSYRRVASRRGLTAQSTWRTRTTTGFQRFDPAGRFLGKWGSQGTGQGQFETPFRVAVAPNGTVYVADSGNHRVQVFAADGTYQTQWGGQGNGDGQFDGPTGLAVAPDGTVYVADANNHRVQIFEAAPCADGGGRAEQPTRSIRWGAGESVVAFADTP